MALIHIGPNILVDALAEIAQTAFAMARRLVKNPHALYRFYFAARQGLR